MRASFWYRAKKGAAMTGRKGQGMARMRMGHIALMLGGTIVLSACEDGKDFNLFKKKTEIETTDRAAVPSNSVKLVERDIEAPDVFQVSEKGLWDGRPSLGGVWIAHGDVKDPERVIIRNEDNGKFVIGALFRRERDNPGPKLQVSSDAAAALGMLAGAPDKLNVTALRRSEVPAEGQVADAILQPPAEVETASLDPIALATAALDEADATAGVATAPALALAPAIATPARPSPTSKLSKPFIQIGLFSVQENADRTGTVLRGVGVVPNIDKNNSRGKDFWRVTVGPATSSAERATLLKKIKGLGYDDAYYVTN